MSFVYGGVSIVLGQVRTDEKSDEITLIPESLAVSNLTEAIVSVIKYMEET